MVTSPRRAALDRFIRNAETVLQEQRALSISPSTFAGVWEPRPHSEQATLGEVERNLASVLDRMVYGPGRWVLIVGSVDGCTKYVQFLGYEDGSLVAEAVSNAYLVEPHRLSEDDEAALLRLGWQPPCPPADPTGLSSKRPSCRMSRSWPGAPRPPWWRYSVWMLRVRWSSSSSARRVGGEPRPARSWCPAIPLD